MSEQSSEDHKKLALYLDELEQALVQYDESSDTLYIILSDEEADEVLLLENNIVVRAKNGRIIGLTVLELSRRVKEV